MIPKKRFWTRKKLNTIPALWLFVCAVLPLLYLIVIQPVIDVIQAENIALISWNLFNVSNWLVTIFNTIFVALISTVLGAYLAFFAIFRRNSLRYILFFIIGFCFIINPIIHYEIINNFFGKTGVLNALLLHNGLISKQVIINPYWILLVSLVYKFIPISFFICIPALHNINTNLIEYTLDFGANPLYIITHNIVYEIKHHLTLAFGMIFLLVFGNISLFIVPFIEKDFTYHIMLNVTMIKNSFGNYSFLSQWDPFLNINLALFSLIWVLGVYLLNKYFNKNKANLYLNPFKRLSKYKCVFIGKDLFTTSISCGIIIFYVLSILGFVFYSFKDWNLYFHLFDDAKTLNSIKNQYNISIFAAIISTIFGTMLAVGNSKSTDLRKHDFYKYTVLALATSEIILFGISIFNNIYIFDPFATTLIALSIMGTLLSAIYMYGIVRGIDKNIENASIDLGANYWQTIKLVTLYSLYPAAISCFLLVFICLFNEFNITSMFLQQDTLSSKLLYLFVEKHWQANQLSSINILFTTAILLIASPHNLHSEVKLILKSIVVILLLALHCIFLFFS